MKALACCVLLFASCAPSALLSNHPAPTVDQPVMTGTLSRAMVAKIPGWTSDAPFDVSAAKKLATVPPGAEVTIIIGTWCSDSKRELPRLWQALDLAGPVPFAIELIGVDRDKKSPGLDMDVAYVPLLIVRRGGKEVGRIVESAPGSIEVELLALLDGTKTGVVSGRAELQHARP